MNKLTQLIIVSTLTLVAAPVIAADEDVKIESIALSDNIHMLTGKGGNIGVFIGPDGTFVIDDQFAPLTPKILATIDSIGGQKPRFLINTHFHGDHTGGNENMGKADTLILSHHNVRKRLENGSFIAAFGMKSPPAARDALPEITFSKKMKLHINGETVQAIHVPAAHTDGDSFIHFPNANVVHAGDLFFNGFYPFIDAAHGGTMEGMIRGVNRILAITDDDSKIIPGHGPLAARKDLVAYRDMLTIAYERLLNLKNQGMSAEDAVIEAPLDDLEKEWGDGIFSGDRWITIVYPAVR